MVSGSEDAFMAGRLSLACLALCVLALCLLAPAASAHGGGLDANGCHTNRKTGDYHCHRPQATPPVQTRTPPAAARPSPQTLLAPGTGSTPFRNCTEARLAGAAPVRRGDPGYGAHLDRDNDGIGCE
jgi:hypothetical protein